MKSYIVTLDKGEHYDQCYLGSCIDSEMLLQAIGELELDNVNGYESLVNEWNKQDLTCLELLNLAEKLNVIVSYLIVETVC